MPSWAIHNKWARRLGIDDRIADEINREIDSIEHPELHDYGRVIIDGTWVFYYLHEELSRYYNEVCGGYCEEFRKQCVGAFLLHHVLDYASTLLHSPSVMLNPSRARGLAIKLVNGVAEDYSKRRDSLGELAQIVLYWCGEIKRLIEEEWEGIVSDVKPEASKHIEWAKNRLIKVSCLKCGKAFTTIDNEGLEFLALMQTPLSERFIKYCFKCRGMERIYTYLLMEKDHVMNTFKDSPRGSPFYRTYYCNDKLWSDNVGRWYALIYLLAGIEHTES